MVFTYNTDGMDVTYAHVCGYDCLCMCARTITHMCELYLLQVSGYNAGHVMHGYGITYM